MLRKKFKGRSFRYDLRYNDLGYYEIIEIETGQVVGTRVDRLSASSLLYEFDGIYQFEPQQLELF